MSFNIKGRSWREHQRYQGNVAGGTRQVAKINILMVFGLNVYDIFRAIKTSKLAII